MATIKQMEFRLRNAKKTLKRLNKDLPATKSRIKKLQTQLTKAKAAEKAAKAKKKKKAAAKKRPATNKEAAKNKK